jgi:hypothetical protein
VTKAAPRPRELWVPSDDELALMSDDELILVARYQAKHLPRWSPQPKQALAEELSQQADETLYGGAAFGGKTEWLLEHLIGECERHPGNNVILFRRKYTSLLENVIPRAKSKLFGRARWDGEDKAFKFDNGSRFKLGHMNNADTWRQYQGSSYGAIGWEEVTEFLEEQYLSIQAWVRAPVDGVRPHNVATTNPGGLGHKWVKRRFIRPLPEDVDPDSPVPEPYRVWQPAAAEDEPIPPGTRVFVPATKNDNPIGMARNPRYPAMLRAIANRGLRLAMDKGDWDAIDEVEGALWTMANLDGGRVQRGHLQKIGAVLRAVAVDPSEGGENSDEYAAWAGGVGTDGVGYTTHSFGWRSSPRQLALNTVSLVRETGAGVVVLEKNAGGAWIKTVLLGVDPYLNVRLVHARDKKRTRAEPVAALFEPDDQAVSPLLRYRARLEGHLPELEETLTTHSFTSGEASPDQLDALVWGYTFCLLGPRVVDDEQTYRDDRLRGRR